MTRSVDATLHAALQAGTGKPVAIGYIGYSDGSVSKSGPVSQFKLTATTLQFTIPNITTFAGDQTHIWLSRGLNIAGTDYLITTGRFAIRNQRYLPNKTQVIDADLFPATYYSALAYDTYDNVINAFCTAMGKTAVYREAGEAWHAYKFLGAGQYLVLTDGMSMLPLLQQKRLISVCDIGSEQVLVYCADAYGGTDLSIAIKDDFALDHTLIRSRQFIWKDEVNVYHQAGTVTDPIHNLGYMESTDSPPARHTATHQLRAVIRPDLRIVDGDRVSFTAWGTATSSLFARVTEQLEADSRGVPQWRTILEANTCFDNTEGGTVPASVEKTAHYIPVNTSAFDDLLTAKDNNLQHALETLDDHPHTAIDVAPAHGLLATIAAGATMYLTPYNPGLNAGLNAVWTLGGNFKILRLRINSAQPAGGSLVITLQINTGDTAIVLTIPAGSGAGSYVDNTHTAAALAGNLVRFKLVNNAPAAVSAQIDGLGIQCQYQI